MLDAVGAGEGHAEWQAVRARGEGLVERAEDVEGGGPVDGHVAEEGGRDADDLPTPVGQVAEEGDVLVGGLEVVVVGKVLLAVVQGAGQDPDVGGLEALQRPCIPVRGVGQQPVLQNRRPERDLGDLVRGVLDGGGVEKWWGWETGTESQSLPS